jgi:hypothetical protein
MSEEAVLDGLEHWMLSFKADARRTSALVREQSQNGGHSAKVKLLKK